jgi:hypothetical protein
MPRGPKGEKRPADAIGAAVMVGRIATGEIEEEAEIEKPEVAFARLGGQKGGPARAATLSSDERRRIAKAAAEARWRKSRKPE